MNYLDERDAWAAALAFRHGRTTQHPPHRQALQMLAIEGYVGAFTVHALNSLLAQASGDTARTELAWLLTYCIDVLGALTVLHGHRSVTHRRPYVRGWLANRVAYAYDPTHRPPAWWPTERVLTPPAEVG